MTPEQQNKALERKANEIVSLRAELAEAKAMRDEVLIDRNNLVAQNINMRAEWLALQSHNAKLEQWRKDAVWMLEHFRDNCDDASVRTSSEELIQKQSALASQPDHELRDRVGEVLQFYASAWVRSTFNGVQKFNHPDDELTNDGGHRATELLSSL